MKITTMKITIKHERNDNLLFAAIEKGLEELAPMEEVAEALIDTLRKINPNVRDVVAEDSIVILEIGTSVREVSIADFTFPDLYTSLVAECLK